MSFVLSDGQSSSPRQIGVYIVEVFVLDRQSLFKFRYLKRAVRNRGVVDVCVRSI